MAHICLTRRVAIESFNCENRGEVTTVFNDDVLGTWRKSRNDSRFRAEFADSREPSREIYLDLLFVFESSYRVFPGILYFTPIPKERRDCGEEDIRRGLTVGVNHQPERNDSPYEELLFLFLFKLN